MALTTHEAARLRQLEAEFAAAGGRGVELADEIDALRAKRDRNRGRVRYMRVTVRRVEEITYEASTEDFPHVDFAEVDLETFARAHFGTFDESSSSYLDEEVVSVAVHDLP